MANFRLSPNAARSLAAIDKYTTKNFGPQQTVRYLENILERLQFIANHPDTGNQREDIKVGYLSYFVGSHTIYYRITKDEIEVIDVLHQSMEPKRHLP